MNLDEKSLNFLPIINTLQKISIYETYHSLYVIGSNLAETYFRVLKLDRTCEWDRIEFSDDVHEYDKDEMNELLSMINNANRIKNSNGILKAHKGHGIVGFIRFLEGYYLILITKQIPVAILGFHTIYSIEDATLIYIPYEDKSLIRDVNLDEQRYLKLFQTVDLRQNFYYSYTYDLTHTLQFNLSEIRVQEPSRLNIDHETTCIGVVNKPESKFLWNDYLLKPLRGKVNHFWILNIIHGFLSQSSLNIYGCSIYITLISRRSQKYAGTRFLKRGGTREGYVANEVETEQIVHNAHISSFLKGWFTSFVHIRGSIPLLWSQDPKQVPKPPINIDIYDPFSSVAAAHFQRLFHRHGAPIIVLNLVKMREKKAQESTLAHEYKYCLEYLEQFLPDDQFFQYIYFDMAKLNKTDKGNVMNRLYDIAENCVEKIGFFQNSSGNERKQKGIIRVNCVDCLDRTNTAMYVIGKCALAHQLYALGVIPQPFIEVDNICEKILIDLYEKSGDCIAQQYAGSQLVHRVDTYGTKNSLASQFRDNMHTISRYYSNAFSDADKQSAINLFLGVFKPFMHSIPIWELQTDIYLHDRYLNEPWKQPIRYNNWIDEATFKSLPLASDEVGKTLENSMNTVEMIKDFNSFKIDMFNNYYKPHKLTVFHETYYFNILPIHRLNETAHNSLTSGLKAIILDPFKRNSTKRLDINQSTIQQNAPSNNSNTPQSLNNSSDSDTDDTYTVIQQELNCSPKFANFGSKDSKELLKSQINQIDRKIFASDVKVHVSDTSMSLYKKYVSAADSIVENSFPKIFSFNQEKSLVEIVEPKVSAKSMNLYRTCVNVGSNGPNEPNISIYEDFIKKL